MDTVLIQLTNHKALALLKELEELHIIKVLKTDVTQTKKLSEKYKGILTKDEGKQLNDHIQQMRNEWNKDI